MVPPLRQSAESDGRDGAVSGVRFTGPIDHALRWVLLSGGRRALAITITVVILASLLFVGTVWEFEMERLVTETRAVQTLFNTLLGGIILFVSVVLSINTAALAQEFAPLQLKLASIEESIAFQEELEELVDEGVSPAGLGPFLEYVIGAIRTETTSLRAAGDDEPATDALTAFVRDVDAQLSTVERRVGRADPGVSVLLLSSLEYPYARHINLARHLRAVYGDDLSTSDAASLDALLRFLTMLASGREYFTTLYFKRELRNLSTDLLLLSLPVIVFTAYVLLAIDAGIFPTTTVPGIGARLLYVNVAFVVALSPYVLLSSYMLRILVVSKHALASTVFTLETDSE